MHNWVLVARTGDQVTAELKGRRPGHTTPHGLYEQLVDIPLFGFVPQYHLFCKINYTSRSFGGAADWPTAVSDGIGCSSGLPTGWSCARGTRTPLVDQLFAAATTKLATQTHRPPRRVGSFSLCWKKRPRDRGANSALDNHLAFALL